MNKINVYKHGLAFSEVLALNIDAVLKRIDDKKASLIIIDGPQGEGKTTLAQHIVEYCNKGPINYKYQYANGGEEFINKFALASENGYNCVIYDEAGDFDSRGAITKFNRNLNSVFESFRAFKVLVILCLPTFSFIDKKMFTNEIPRLLLHLRERNKSQGNFRGFDLPSMLHFKKIIKKYDIAPAQALKFVGANFYGHFKDLDEHASKELEKISIDKKRERINDINKKNFIRSSLYTTGQICKEVERSAFWVYTKAKELNLKPVQQYGKANYYNAEQLQKLKDLI